jgi:dephospho-CoA kinase
MVVGITGSYCSGKDVACSLFRDAGYRIVDVDRIGHDALQVKREELCKEFGAEILRGETVDRRKLGSIVFSSDEKRRQLERIVHPWMIREVRRRIVHDGPWVINAALLIEMCLWVLCDYVIGVDAETEVLVERARSRDGLHREEALRRIHAQIPIKEKLHFVDIKVDNNGDLERFRGKILTLIVDLGQKVNLHGR